MSQTISILIAGTGGQGVLKASQVLADALLRQGYDVKQSEVHGMSQRGGSVISEVRFGETVHSPLTPHKKADFVIAIAEDEGRRAAPCLKEGIGKLIEVSEEIISRLADHRSRNMAALGCLSTHLDIPRATWYDAIKHHLPPKSLANNFAAFDLGAES